MTTEQLQNRIRTSGCASGQFQVTIEWRNAYYRCNSNDTLSYYRIRDDESSPREKRIGGTLKQALQALYNECKRANHLGEYNY